MKKEEFFIKDNSCYFFDDPKAVAEYCRENWAEDTAHILRVADEVCEGYFLFDLRWDMERTYEPVIFKDKIDWECMPYGDPEFIYQFNRHRFFICLGQAYQLTGDEKYAKGFTGLLMDWITNVKKIPGNQAWRILEVGIRGENWTKAIRYFKDSPYLTEEVLTAFYQSLIQHAEYIMDTYDSYRLLSNWGVLENHGLFEIAMALPPGRRQEEYIGTAIERLDNLARIGIMNDGVQWEQSPMYHNEVLHCYLDVMILAGRNHIELPKNMTDKVKLLAYANLWWKKPNHRQFMMGDSDDTDVRDMITVAAYLYKDPVLKFGGYDILDFESAWDLGIEAAKEYELLQKKDPGRTSVALSDSGNYYLRSGWEENANLLHLHCGTLGGGHGHSDKLHIDLVLHGEDILMDAGRFTYVQGPDRYEFKDPTAHNTMLVDGKFFTLCKDAWGCSKLSQPVKQQLVTGEEYEFVQGGHLGYMDLDNGVFHNRKIIYIKPDIYIIADEMYTGGAHEYNQFFHFNNQGRVTIEGNKVSYSGEKADAKFYFITSGLGLEKIRTRLSRNYNQTEENETIKTTFRGEGFASAITVIHGGGKEDLQELTVEKLAVDSALKGIRHPDSMAEAVKLTIRDKSYVVCICHQEVNSPADLVKTDGCIGFGNVIVFDKACETAGGTVLNW